jgi:hypothetical protein
MGEFPQEMVGKMDPFVPAGERMDRENLSLTDAVQVSNQTSVWIPSKDHDEIEGLKNLRKVEIEGPFSNKKRGHAFLVDESISSA